MRSRTLATQHCGEAKHTKSAASLQAKVRKDMANLADARLTQCERCEQQEHVSSLPGKANSVEGWYERWVDSGLVKATQGEGRKVRVVGL